MREGQSGKDKTILQAVDQLAQLAELDLEDVKEGMSSSLLGKSTLLSMENESSTIQSVKESMKVVHAYLKELVHTKSGVGEDVDARASVKSIVSLAQEAADKLDQCRLVFKKVAKQDLLTEAAEFQSLVQFYQEKFNERFETHLQAEQKWQMTWKEQPEAADFASRGMKNLEAILKDRHYELFQIMKEDGTPFYHQNVARHIQLVANFDQLVVSSGEEDPFLFINHENGQLSTRLAEHLYSMLLNIIDPLWLQMKKVKESQIPYQIYLFWMAVSAAKKSGQLPLKKQMKSPSSYMDDALYFLRDLIEMRKLPIEDELLSGFIERLDQLIESTSLHLITHSNQLNPFLNKIDQITAKEKSRSERVGEAQFPFSFLDELLAEYDAIFQYLRKFPSGPLFKVLEILQQERAIISYDPWIQGNLPETAFRLNWNKKEKSFIRLPSPTSQHVLTKAKVIHEFESALTSLTRDGKKMLVIQLQDRTSQQEYARAKALENLSKSAFYKDTLNLLTLPKQTDFYFQSNDYSKMSDANSFVEVIKEQFEHGSESGFFISPGLDKQDLLAFGLKAIDWIHEEIFDHKALLSRRERLDYIELFYTLLTLYAIASHETEYVAFCCKDGVDVTPAALAGLLGFVGLISSKTDWKNDWKDLLRQILFVPSLRIRERVIDGQVLTRSLSMLYLVGQKWKQNPQGFKSRIEKLMGTKLDVVLD